MQTVDLKPFTILEGSCLETLKTLPDNSIQMCVTSPPYFNLRDYGTGHWEGGDPNCQHQGKLLSANHNFNYADGRGSNGEMRSNICQKCGAIRVDEQIGLEETPEQFIQKLVDVFHEVKRVLKPDGTLWVNMGDSYCNSNGYERTTDTWKREGRSGAPANDRDLTTLHSQGYKTKDLIGIPWKLAEALRSPYYLGSIKNELDRVWIASTLDSEGSICGTVHERKDGTGARKSLFINITNTNKDMLLHAQKIFPKSSITLHTSITEHSSHLGKRDVYRWNVLGMDSKLQFIQEIYPYLIVKRKQALVAYNFLLLQQTAKSDGHTDKKDSVNSKREYFINLLSELNSGNDVDTSGLIEPPSLWEKGWYLRQDIIFAKNNPMPESVEDRCTKSHEYIFLLSKSPNYYFDYKAIEEEAISDAPSNPKFGGNKYGDSTDTHFQTYSGNEYHATGKRRKRDVWNVSVSNYKEAHFATYPIKLIEPCILAGSKPGDIVLDPFSGSGTTGIASIMHDRKYIGCELNPEYVKLSYARYQEEILGNKVVRNKETRAPEQIVQREILW